MQIINFGSINFDRTYRVEHFPSVGETMQIRELVCGSGGKGLNQSIAASRAGASVIHAGTIGIDGDALEEELKRNGVDISRLLHVDTEQGHAVIVVDEEGNNEILVHRGSNLMIGPEYIGQVFSSETEPSLVVLQNEITHADRIIDEAFERGHTVVFNASPVNDEMIQTVDFSHVHWLLINEVEGAQLTGESDPEMMIDALRDRFPQMNGVLTLGTEGSVCWYGEERFRYGSYEVPVVDTTGAGDTYTGYFLAGLALGKTPEESVVRATLAAGISVTRAGAAASVPLREEVEEAYRSGRYLLRRNGNCCSEG